jgi:hypothetical protein
VLAPASPLPDHWGERPESLVDRCAIREDIKDVRIDNDDVRSCPSPMEHPIHEEHALDSAM